MNEATQNLLGFIIGSLLALAWAALTVFPRSALGQARAHRELLSNLDRQTVARHRRDGCPWASQTECPVECGANTR